MNAPAQQPRSRVNWRKCCALVLAKLHEEGLTNDALVVLIGSYARGVPSWRSDVDILAVLSKPSRGRLNVIPEVHLHIERKIEFLKRLDEGDDYALSAVKLGKLLYDDRNLWPELQRRAENASWPSSRPKLEQADRRISSGDELLTTGDSIAAEEEYLFAASQIARAVLLRRSVLPLSRPELAAQLLELGQSSLAAQLTALIEGENGIHELAEIRSSLKRALDQERSNLGP